MTLTSAQLDRVKTKIIATVGPATESKERLTELINAGVDVFRLNLAHGDRQWHESLIRRIQQTSQQQGRPIAILADLGGPKIRLGPVAGGSVLCNLAETFRLVARPEMVQSPSDLTSSYTSLVEELDAGDLVLLSDGSVSLQVTTKEPEAAICRVVQPGEIRTGCGINLPGVALDVPALTEKDRQDLQWAAAQELDFFGLSFVRRAADVQLLRKELARLKSSAQIVAKIEKPQAVERLDEIIHESDAIMVARGDLGVETDVARIAIVQKQIISRCHQAHIPVITATQMLESMRTSRLPTRAEATDVANAILDGTDALMLSAETAVGQYPVEAVAMMQRIASETERLLDPRKLTQTQKRIPSAVAPVTEALVEASSHIADQLRASLVIVASHSGKTALALSKQRNSTPTLGISDCEPTVRRMCLYWGVIPLHTEHFHDSSGLLNHCVKWAQQRHGLSRGDRVVLIASTHWASTGHDMLVVHEVD